MAKKLKNRGNNTGAEQAQKGQEQVLDETNDAPNEHVSGPDGADQNQGPVSGGESTEESPEGSDTTADIAPLEEGLVGDESDAPVRLRGANRHIATLDEVPFLPPTDGEPATLGEGPVLTDEEIAAAVAQLPEGDATRDGATISTRILGEIIPEQLQDIAQSDDELSETPVSEEEQAAATATLLAQEPQPEPKAPGWRKLLEERLSEFTLVDDEPVINHEVRGQVGFLALDKWTVPDLRASLVDKVGADAAAAWSREQMLTFHETGAFPNKTVRGNWIYDARRTHNTKAWSASELSDFIDGKLLLDRSVDVSLVWEEAYARYRVPNNWTVEAFRQFVCDSTRPEVTASGVLVEDRMRDQKQAHHLTFRELRAAALGEIEVPHTRDAVLSHLRKRLGLSENHSEERMLAQLPDMTNEVSMDNTFLTAKLEEYKAVMIRNPATLTEETAGAAQGMLYDAIRKVIKREFNEFVEGWNIILDFVNENHVALFDPYKARRGWAQVPLGKQQLALFEDLLTLIIRTREPGNRAAAAKLYNLEVVLRHMPNENERQNLFMYYSAP